MNNLIQSYINMFDSALNAVEDLNEWLDTNYTTDNLYYWLYEVEKPPDQVRIWILNSFTRG